MYMLWNVINKVVTKKKLLYELFGFTVMFKRKSVSTHAQAQVSKPGHTRFLNECGVVWSWIANPVCYTLESSNGFMNSMNSEILSLSAISFFIKPLIIISIRRMSFSKFHHSAPSITSNAVG